MTFKVKDFVYFLVISLGFIKLLCIMLSFNIYIILLTYFFFLHLRVTQKALQLSFFFTFFSSRQCCWTDWQKFFACFISFFPRAHVTSMGLISLDTLKKVCLEISLTFHLQCVWPMRFCVF